MDCTESPSAETSVTAVKDPEAANAEIVQAMEAGEGDEATRLIREALARWPNYTRLQLTQGEVFHKFAGAAQAHITLRPPRSRRAPPSRRCSACRIAARAPPPRRIRGSPKA